MADLDKNNINNNADNNTTNLDGDKTSAFLNNIKDQWKTDKSPLTKEELEKKKKAQQAKINEDEEEVKDLTKKIQSKAKKSIDENPFARELSAENRKKNAMERYNADGSDNYKSNNYDNFNKEKHQPPKIKKPKINYPDTAEIIINKKPIYMFFAAAAALAFLLPTISFEVVGVSKHLWFDALGRNLSFLLLWLVGLILPIVILLLALIVKQVTDKIKAIMFAVVAFYIFAIYPIAMKIVFLSGYEKGINYTWNDVYLYLGIGGVVAGVFCLLGVAFAVWSLIYNYKTYKKEARNKVIEY